MSNIIEFGKYKPKHNYEPPLFTVKVYKDTDHAGGVVARFETDEALSHLQISEYLDEISWKGKNIAASGGSKEGRVALVITQYEHGISFVENERVAKTEEYIENLRKEFDGILKCLAAL